MRIPSKYSGPFEGKEPLVLKHITPNSRLTAFAAGKGDSMVHLMMETFDPLGHLDRYAFCTVDVREVADFLKDVERIFVKRHGIKTLLGEE